jgi:phenylacetate-CoA ligase
VGDPEVALWGSPIELTHQDRLRNLRDRLLSTRLFPAFGMNPSTMSRYLDILETHGCRQIFAYPSAIYLLCVHASKQGRDLRGVGVEVVFVTGEVLFPYQREFISGTLNCRVANGYGGRDSGFIAHECPQGEMHLMADAIITEIVDSEGRPAAPGETGEIVVTDLYSHEVPFLRYATGDMGVLSTRQCPCGRALPLLERIDGRSNDAILTPDGRIMNSLAVVYPVREIAGIEQFRIYQKSTDNFHIQLVRNGNFFQTDSEDRIRKAWSELLRSPVQVTFEYLPSLASDPSGKFRHVVSDVAPGLDLQSMENQHTPRTK